MYGYIRVSSADQNESRQRLLMRARSIAARRIYADKVSGKDFQRPQYQAMLKLLRPGDLLCVTSIDRLGRNYEEILEQWRILTKKRQVDILVLDMPLLDTRRDKDLLGTFIADLVLQVLSFVAQNERENIRTRQREGIIAAKLRGGRFGREPKPLPSGFAEACRLWRKGEISASEAARRCGMARSTFRYRAAGGTSIAKTAALVGCSETQVKKVWAKAKKMPTS
jgi:DNA invertase Pin-like site-specific DNA recombinase